MSSAKTCAALALATLVAVTAARAQETSPSLDAFGLLVAQQSRPSFAVLGAGARAAGMGGAFTALADDATAASFNPAGLALLLRPEATVVFGGRRRAETHAPFTQVEEGEPEVYSGSSVSDSSGAPNFAAFTLPFEVGRRNLSLQVSYHRTIEFDWRASRALVETEAGVVAADLFQAIDQSGGVDTFSLAGAIQATERLSLGLTLSRWQGGWSFATSTRETERADSRSDQLRFAQESSWSGWNATLGALLRYRYLNLGAALRTGFEGDYAVDSTLAASFDTPFPERSRFRGELEWPTSWTLGVAIKPLQTWILTVDYAQFDWDDFRILGLPEGPVNFLDLRPAASTRTRSTADLRFGSEVTLFRGPDLWTLRAGHWRAPRAQRLASGDAGDTTLGWTLGVGWRRGPLTFDLAWQRSSSSARALEFVDPETVAGGGVEPQAESEVEVTEQRLLLSVLYQFESRAALERLFHFLFVGPLEPKPAATAPPPAGAARGPR